MSSFESNKNAKAGAYTAIIVGILALLFFIVSWTTPPAKEVNQDEGLEVNLGNSETGLGEIQPLLPDPPAAEEEVQTTPPPPSKTVVAEKEIETNDKDKDAPEVVSIKSKAKVILPPTKAKENLPPTNKPITPPKPTPPIESKPVETPPASPKPKSLYTGPKSDGKGGNNADSYQPSNGQGVTSGKGDQGKPNGNPNSDSYTGNGGNGNGGIAQITGALKGRKIIKQPSFEDDFNENAKIAIDITVDKSGNVINANFQQLGSTTANSAMKAIALKKARQLKFIVNETRASNQIGTVTFVFKIKN